MPLDLELSRTPRSQFDRKPEVPPLVRDYLEYVRGNPEVSGQAPIDYLERLWSQAIDFAERNGVRCPIRRDEIEALRSALKVPTAALEASVPVEETLSAGMRPRGPQASGPAGAKVLAERRNRQLRGDEHQLRGINSERMRRNSP